MKTQRSFRSIQLLAIGLVLVATGSWAADPVAKCESSKLKEAGKYDYCRLKADSKAVIKGEVADYTKCDTKFFTKWDQIEQKAGPGICPSEGDAATMDALIMDHTGSIATTLSGAVAPRYEDCGDGTVADLQTGLMWYKTDDAGGLTDKDNQYSLSAPLSSDNDGTAYTVLLAGLNDCESNDGLTVTGGHAGHCDWRIPQNDELQTLLLEPFPCSTSPCIDELVFGPAVSSFYKSATMVSGNPSVVYGVRFSDGGAQAQSAKTLLSYVRAVRSGSCS